MPRKRSKINKDLPSGWRRLHNAIYYQVPPSKGHLWDNKKLFRLGKDEIEAYRTWADRIDARRNVKTIGQLFHRYQAEVMPKKSKKSQLNNILEKKQLLGVFGDMNIKDLEPHHVYKYIDGRKSKASAQRERALLSHALTMAVQWGYISKHPFKGEIRVEGSKPRTRYVEDWEIVECLALPPMRKKGSVQAIQAYIRLKLLTGLRRGDMLRLRISDFTKDGICVTTSKTGKKIIYGWTDELTQAVEMAKRTRPIDLSPYLFCTKEGKPYIDENGNASGFNSIWKRFMKRVLKETKVEERFTEHDLRAKVASDAETLERAQKLLAHADSKITQKVYRRKAEIIKPVR